MRQRRAGRPRRLVAVRVVRSELREHRVVQDEERNDADLDGVHPGPLGVPRRSFPWKTTATGRFYFPRVSVVRWDPSPSQMLGTFSRFSWDFLAVPQLKR